MQKRLFSVKTLCANFSPSPFCLSKDNAQEIRDLIKGDHDPKSYPLVQKHLKSCYHEPERDHLVMLCINQLLRGYGVEAITNNESDPRYFEAIEYVNVGDSYTNTIFLLPDGQFIISCLADVVTKYPTFGK